MSNQKIVNQQAQERFNNRKECCDENLKQIDNLMLGKEFDYTKVESTPRLIERARRLGLFKEAEMLTRNPADKECGKRVFEQIIAANNLLNVNFLHEGARMANAVGRIVLPVSGGNILGTGFMVSPRIMMTNNHVLGNRIEAGNATLEFDFYRRDNGDTGPVSHFDLRPDLFFVTDEDLDFTLVAVEESNANGLNVSERGWFPLGAASGKAVVGERVSIIQHPSGEPQQVAVHDNKIVDVNFEDDFMHYKCDTMRGSSGSPVLNINWDLVALHHASRGSNNEGVRISSIISRLQEILETESFTVNAALLSELMAARSMLPSDNIPIGGRNNSSNNNHLQINANGTATWSVPVTLTLGVGHMPDSVVPASPGVSTHRNRALHPSEEDPDLREAMQALEASERKTYYSKEQDKQARDEYYPDLSGLDETSLYKSLSSLLADSHTRTLSYKKARLNHLYPWVDRHENNRELRGIYSDKLFDALELIEQEAAIERKMNQEIQKKIARESIESVDEAFLEALEASHPFNCEHVVPQSWFGAQRQPKADLHHLFTSEIQCNSFRSNHAYFDFQTEKFRDNCGESQKGKFEPNRRKGAAARATLYFLLRYPGKIKDRNVKGMPKDRLKTLILWAKSDEVSLWERHRNAEIHKIQGNRNPLIDFPDLVDKINFELGLG